MPVRSATCLRKATSSLISSYRSDMSSGACPIQNLMRPSGQSVWFRRNVFLNLRKMWLPALCVPVLQLLESLVQMVANDI